MTIDERVECFMARLKAGAKHDDLANDYRLSLLEVARDQRHACAEAVMAITQCDVNNPWMVDKDIAHHAVMNAPLP